MSAREYAALASASLAFCPPTHRNTQMKLSQAFEPSHTHEPFGPSHAHSTRQYDAIVK